MNYDQYKTANPYDAEDDRECGFCGVPCKGTYCSTDCKRADIF